MRDCHSQDDGPAKDVLGQWQRFVRGQPLDSLPRFDIYESWLRCRGAGIDPAPGQVLLRRVAEEDLRQRLQAQADVLAVARPHLDWVSGALNLVPHVVSLTDRDGVVLYSIGNFLPMPEVGLVPGCDWSERTMGTNGAGTALVANQPVAVIGPEHYCSPLHPCACLGAPLHNGGAVIGAVAITSGVADANPERLFLARHLAYAIAHELACFGEVHRTGRELAAVEALHESEERFRAFMDHTSAFAWMKNEQGGYAYMNKAYEAHFGLRPEEWRGKTDFEIWPREVAEQFRRNDQEVLRSGQPREVVEHTPGAQGRRRTWLTFKFPFRDRSGRLYSGGIAFDITERKELEREVLEIAALEERRIGQELHDGVGQELTGLGLLADALAQRLTTESPAGAALADKIVHGVGRVRRQVRSLSHGLVPVEVDPEGLRAALERLTASAGESCGCTCTFASAGPLAVADPGMATHLFRIAQEAVNNALCHSQARHIRIALHPEPDALTLSVEDDGVGLSASSRRRGKGLGLRLMRYRAGVIGGTLTLGPAAGGGTLVTCRIPRGARHAYQHSREQCTGDQDPHRR
jgi:PAS domain S-box-containing protein